MQTLCNACGLYWLKNSYSRPISPNSHGKAPSPTIGVKLELPHTPLMRQQPHLRVHRSTEAEGRYGSGQQAEGGALVDSREGTDYQQFPAWVREQRASLMSRYPNDMFEVVHKGPGGPMRIKCLDCPGTALQRIAEISSFALLLTFYNHRQTVSTGTRGNLGQF